MRTLLISLVLAGLSLFITAGALAAPNCGPRDSVVSFLSEKYHEVPVAFGVDKNGGLVEVLSSKDGTTFSILLTSPKGTSCLVGSGEGWRVFEGRYPHEDPAA